MKYNQPYGISDVDAEYINGDPSIGRQGSIPPASSIEYPQREIVEVIQWAYDHGFEWDEDGSLCEAPTNTDLTQLRKAIYGFSRYNTFEVLKAPKDYYVNDSTGHDTNYDGTSATVDGTHGPFKTVQKALDMVRHYNLNGFDFTIHIADGTYTIENQNICYMPNGSGSIIIVGNDAAPANVHLHNSTNGGIFEGVYGGNYELSGVYMSSTGPSIWGGDSSLIRFDGGVKLGNVRFGACWAAHITGSVYIIPNAAIQISGNATAHYAVGHGKNVLHAGAGGITLNILNAVSIGVFYNVSAGGTIEGAYASITGKANVTGQKYSATFNGIINTGTGDVNYLPGTVAGATSTGGQYG